MTWLSWRIQQFLLSKRTFSVWYSALNLDLPLEQTELGHSPCISSVRRGWQGKKKGYRARQQRILKSIRTLSKFGSNLSIRFAASTDGQLSKWPGSADLEANFFRSTPSFPPLTPWIHTMGDPTAPLCTEEQPNRHQMRRAHTWGS